jgi:hypothetical protein
MDGGVTNNSVFHLVIDDSILNSSWLSDVLIKQKFSSRNALSEDHFFLLNKLGNEYRSKFLQKQNVFVESKRAGCTTSLQTLNFLF